MGFLVNPNAICPTSCFSALLGMVAELEWLDVKARASLEMIFSKPEQLVKMLKVWNEDLEQKGKGLASFFFFLKDKEERKE